MTSMAPWVFTCPNSLERKASNTTSSCPNGGLRFVFAFILCGLLQIIFFSGGLG